MLEMTSEERVLRVLQRQEPDRCRIRVGIIIGFGRLLPGLQNHTDFAVQMGHDAIR